MVSDFTGKPKKKLSYFETIRGNSSGRILVNQHLKAHYQKLQNVKPTVDTSTPYTFNTTPTTHRYKQNMDSVRSKQFSSTKCILKLEKYSDDPTVDKIVKSFLGNSYKECCNNISENDKTLQRNKLLLLTSPGVVTKGCSTRHGPNSGDVLLIYHDKFTPEKPFSPRTIKSTATSRLRELRCYNPPVKAVRIRTPKHTMKDTEQKRVNVLTTYERPPDSAQVCTSPMQSESPVLENSFYQNDTKLKKLNKVNNWLGTLPREKEKRKNIQSTETESMSRISITGNTPGDVCVDGNVGKSDIEATPSCKTASLYLKFIESVTNDVLDRGILSDRELNSVLEEHVIRNEYGLTYTALEKATNHLRTTLRIRGENGGDEVRAGGRVDVYGISKLQSSQIQSHSNPTTSLLLNGLNGGDIVESAIVSTLPPRAPSRKTRPYFETRKQCAQYDENNDQRPTDTLRMTLRKDDAINRVPSISPDPTSSEEFLFAQLNSSTNDTSQMAFSSSDQILMDSWPKTNEDCTENVQVQLKGDDTLYEQTSPSISSPIGYCGMARINFTETQSDRSFVASEPKGERLQFVSEPEYISSINEVVSPATCPTEMPASLSLDVKAIQNSEKDVSSLHAIAEGDSYLTTNSLGTDHSSN